MKILKNNCNKEKVKSIVKTFNIQCHECDSELEITATDTHIGVYGAAYITCPCCGEESMVEELEGITLTKDNIDFPVQFHRTNKNLRNVKEIESEEINEDIKKGIEFFRNNKDEHSWYTSTGDTFVNVFRYQDDEEYFVMVAKDFYETYIPFEKGD